MLTAEKPTMWRSRYDITNDGGRVARWEPSWWRSGGAFELDGQRYQVHGNALGSRFELIDRTGRQLASARRVGRKRWTVRSGDRTYEFRRASMWRGDQELLLGDQAVGSVRRSSVWRGSAVADLPGMPEPVQVFVLCVVLAMWDAETVAAVAASSGHA
ncbi:hypothetical protein [Spirilliplanes yamanashiensis]|uniref:Uncharacterized protein n=1 Tax=Spirilliplanes yamanashiensis TaxID=42233 RepID=A0A8J3Y747_9ACTN|nr:hypothetical protein [Spirilliplanes yamanashiensis]MDP9817236.1 hypothetical protein [Spirilliplanes yamanashiensis]GIJ03111.1 hypothetical protein Sya03_24630 [Spirilliplanes yamanashiensis]